MLRSLHLVELGSVDAFGDVSRSLAAMLIELTPVEVERLLLAARRGEPAIHVETVDVASLRQLAAEAGIL